MLDELATAAQRLQHVLRAYVLHLLTAVGLKEPEPVHNDFPYLESILLFSACVFVLHTYLDVRQLRAIKQPHAPAILKGHLDEGEFRKTRAYNVDKWWFGLANGLVSAVITTVWVVGFWMPWLWDRSVDLVARFGYSGEVKATVVFCLLDGAKDLVLGLPWGLYGTFVIEERHGFNKQTLGLWAMDLVKQIGLGLVILPPCVAGFTLILQHTSAAMVLYLWLFMLGLQLLALTVYPTLIAPLFNKFESLQQGPLREKIEALAGSLKFPLTKLYVIDGSKRSDHSNAYMYVGHVQGFWRNKRIVLFDTLVEQCKEEEVVAVLAHELGHWKLGHTLRNLILVQVNLLTQFVLFALIRTSPGLLRSFGFVHAQPAFIAFTLFNIVLSPLDEVVSLLTNILSRHYEFQADGFAVDLGHAQPLGAALKVLDKKNRSASNVDPWYSALHHSHPPLVQRLEAINAASKKEE